MQVQEFIRQVQQRGQFAGEDEAVQAIAATLDTLCERLTVDEGNDLRAQLPRGIVRLLRPVQPERQGNWGLDEFLRRVGSRTGAGVDAAQAQAQAVLATVREAVSEGEIKDVLAQLPAEFDVLWGNETSGGQ